VPAPTLSFQTAAALSLRHSSPPQQQHTVIPARSSIITPSFQTAAALSHRHSRPPQRYHNVIPARSSIITPSFQTAAGASGIQKGRQCHWIPEISLRSILE
jgi:hypothetical protein